MSISLLILEKKNILCEYFFYFYESIFKSDITYINFGLLKSICSPDSINSSNFSFNLTAPSVITFFKIYMVIAGVKNSGISLLRSGAIP